jgi:hypothetical protein
MEKIKKLERKIHEEINKSKDELINFGVELENFHFEFESKYTKLLEYLDKSRKICLDRYSVEFVLMLPSLINKREGVCIRFLPVLKESVVAPAINAVEDLEPSLYIFIPTLGGVFEEDIYFYLSPNDLFSLGDGFLSLKLKPLVKYIEFVL